MYNGESGKRRAAVEVAIAQAQIGEVSGVSGTMTTIPIE